MGDFSATFEWDETKREATLEKHGIDFVRAVRVFAAPVLTKKSIFPDEERFVSIGRCEGVFIAVVYTIRGDSYRIITARRARRGEISDYHARYSD